MYLQPFVSVYYLLLYSSNQWIKLSAFVAHICMCVRPSHLKQYRKRRSRYEIPIGNGLFSSRDRPSCIVYFMGKLLLTALMIQ